jgi:hypothetical protein
MWGAVSVLPRRTEVPSSEGVLTGTMDQVRDHLRAVAPGR